MTFCQIFHPPTPVLFPSPYPVLAQADAEKILSDCEEGTYLLYHSVDSCHSILRVSYMAQENLITASIYWNGQYQLQGKLRIYTAPTPEELLEQFPQLFIINHRFINETIHMCPWYFGRQKAFEIEESMAKCPQDARLVYFDTDVKTYILAWKKKDCSIEFIPIEVTSKGLSIRDESYSDLYQLLENFYPKSLDLLNR